MVRGARASEHQILSDLYGLTSFSAEGATDYWGCQLNGVEDCPSRQFDTYIGSNPNLEAEESESFSISASYEFLDSWMVSINYFNLEFKTRLSTPLRKIS